MGRKRSPGRIRRFSRYLNNHSPAEVFGGLARRAARSIASVFGHLRFLADPFMLSVITGAALVAGGFAVVGLAWRGAADQLSVALQLAYLVSGGLGGVALVLVGLGVLHIQGSRRLAAKERARMVRVTNNAALLLEAAILARGQR